MERPDSSSHHFWTREPRYLSLYPSERGQYLSWLASGRTQPTSLSPTYWKLFVSGLEWRLFVEQHYEEELGLAVAELLNRYQAQGDSTLLIPWLHWWAHFNSPEHHDQVLDWLLECGWQPYGPDEKALALADLARANLPLKADLAYAMIPGLHNRHSGSQ